MFDRDRLLDVLLYGLAISDPYSFGYYMATRSERAYGANFVFPRHAPDAESDY